MLRSAIKSLYSGNLDEDFSAHAERVNILVVDDLPEKHLAYEAILEELGQNLVMARSGEEALKLVLAQEFAVILLDVNMPGMDGFETAALIRQRKRSAHTPIIFLTAFTDEMRMAQGYASGAVDYLPTPVVPEILRAKVRVFIELSQMRRQAASQAEERVMRSAAEEAARRSEFLVKASEIFTSASSEQAILQALAQLPISYLADASMVWMAPTEEKTAQQEWCWKDSQGPHFNCKSLKGALPVPGLEDALQEVMRNGKPKLLRQPVLSKLSLSQISDTFPRMHSAILLPIVLHKQLAGVILLADKGDDIILHPNAVALIVDLIARACVSLEKVMLLERIQEADRRKDEFLAMLAHELRNPLAPIRNALQLMKATKDHELQEEAQAMIERQLNHLIHLVDDLMDVSRITKGKIELRKQKLLLKDVLSHAIEISDPLIQQKNHTLKIKLPPTPVWLEADSSRIAQVFSNLLNNAAKYTDDGGLIEVEAELQDSSVKVIVRDDGIGIPPSMLSSVFDLFSQVDSTLERTQGGLGIGLTLVKSLVEMHDGTVKAHSKEKGSEFIVILPLAALENDAVNHDKEVTQESQARPIRVLIVDDSKDSAKTLGWMVEYAGHETRLAHDGASAIKIAETYEPNVILLDIGLPGMNGYEVCKVMHENPVAQKAVFIAQTGWGQPEHRQRSREAGFDHHLVKPIDMQVLKHLLNGIAQSQ